MEATVLNVFTKFGSYGTSRISWIVVARRVAVYAEGVRANGHAGGGQQRSVVGVFCARRTIATSDIVSGYDLEKRLGNYTTGKAVAGRNLLTLSSRTLDTSST